MPLDQLVMIALAAGLAALGALVTWLIVLRLTRTFRLARDRRLEARYRPLVDAAVADGIIDPLLRSPRSHRPAIARLLLAPLASVAGDIVSRTRDVATAIGLTDAWQAGTADRRWWRRADAAQALGLLGVDAAVPALAALLHDPHETVRSAAVNALGLIGDARALPHLLRCAASPERYPHVRVMRSLRRFGSAVTAAALEMVREDPASLSPALDVLACCAGPEAIDPLLEWTQHVEADIRAAAWSAIATIGPDDRAYYHARRAETDPADVVRQAAARVVQRSARGREAA